MNQNLFFIALGTLTLINLSLFDFAFGTAEPTVNQLPFNSIVKLENDEVKRETHATSLFEGNLDSLFEPLLENTSFKIKESLKFFQDDIEKAKHYKFEAEQGVAKAQHNLGVHYLTGRGVPQNHKEAARLFQLAAEQGIAESQYNMGVCYRKGIGVPQDEKEALRLIQLTAEKGVSKAQYNLGIWYLKGKGVPQDKNEALRLIQLAADKRHPLAQLCLGRLYYEGQGALKDDKKALEFFQLAANQGISEARSYLELFQNKKRKLQHEEEEEEEAARILLQLAADQWQLKVQSH